jgi:hypothetical protein
LAAAVTAHTHTNWHDHITVRLLIAEDDTDLRQVMTELLAQSGFDVDGCADGARTCRRLPGRGTTHGTSLRYLRYLKPPYA